MATVQRFALVFGVVYLLVGVLGFIPPLRMGNFDTISGPSSGVLLGLFAVNWFHNLAHLLIGLVGLGVYRSYPSARIYALALGIVYAVLFLLGIFGDGLQTLGGLLPLNWLDDILHLVTALIAFAAFFISQREASARRLPSAR